jgi:hypothetical protein
LAPPASKYTFPREVPTKDDWMVWANFWRGYTNTGEKLKTPLGNWKKSTHRIWQWFYDKSDDNLQHLSEGGIIHFKPVRSFMGTRSTTTYQRAWDEEQVNNTIKGRPTSVRVISPTQVIKLCEGSQLVIPQTEGTDFWDFIQS